MSDRVRIVRRRRGYTRISPKHQVTLPVAALETAGLSVGDELKVDIDGDGRIVLTRARTLAERRLAAIEATAGSLTGVWEPGDLERLRDEWR